MLLPLPLKVQTIVYNIFYSILENYVKLPWMRPRAIPDRTSACIGILWFMQVEAGQQEKGFPAWLFFLVGIVAVWIVKAIIDRYLKKNSNNPKNEM